MTKTNDGGAADLTTDALKRLAELRPIRDALGERGDLFMRLNGFYRVGPDGSGEPEFGYSDFRDSEYRQPIQQEAAEALRELIERREADERAALTPAPTAQEVVPACKHLRTTHSRPGYDPLRPEVITCGDCGAVLSPDAHPPQPSVSVAEAAEVLLGDSAAIKTLVNFQLRHSASASDKARSMRHVQVVAALRALKGGES